MTHNLCVIDGPRGAGKTTVVDAIIQRCRAEERHDVQRVKMQRPADPFLQMHKFLCEVEETPELTYICDRFVLTERVMSDYFNRMGVISLRYKTDTVLRRLYELEALHIILLPQIKIIEQRLEEREDDRKWDIPKTDVMNEWNSALRECEHHTFIMFANESSSDITNIVQVVMDYVKEK